jgi:hypothetical protein
VGWKEYLDFPDWGLRRIKAKLDTGARTSALDVLGFDSIITPDRGNCLRLRLALDHRHPERITVVEVPLVRWVVVANSGGTREQRPLIETVVRLGPIRKPILFTVTNRSSLRFRIILGRRALAGDFLIDVGQKYLLRRLAR